MGLYNDDIGVAVDNSEYRYVKSNFERLQEGLQEKKDVGAIITLLANTMESLETAAEKYPILLKKDKDFKKMWSDSVNIGKRIEKDAKKDSTTKEQLDAYGSKITRFLKAA